MKIRTLKPILITIAFLATFGAGFALSKMVSTPPETLTMKKVTGIGGVFFKCKDPKKVKEWYARNLGLQTDKYEYGKFIHILDIEGNKIELWQPDDIEYGKIVGGVTK